MTSGPDALPRGGNAGPQYHGNGLASLFQDEQVLSGDGRLEPGKYDFGFDLVFPEQGLPSSIDVRYHLAHYDTHRSRLRGGRGAGE